MQRERDCLLAEVENLAANSDGQTQKLEDIHAQKLKELEAQVKNPISLFCKFVSAFARFKLEDILNCKNIFKTLHARFWI